MALYNESRSLDVTNLQGAALTRCLRLRLREIVADVREQHNLPHDKPLALKIGGATEDRGMVLCEHHGACGFPARRAPSGLAESPQ